MSNYNITYKNWSFEYPKISVENPTNASETLIVPYFGGYLNYAQYKNEQVAPNFFIYNNPLNDQPYYPVHLKCVGHNMATRMPRYVLYDGLQLSVNNLMINLRCWGFYNIWVDPVNGTVYEDAADHSAAGHFRLNYLDSDWVFWSETERCLKARITLSNGEYREDYIRSDAYGTSAPILYNLCTIQSGVKEDDYDNEYICEYVPKERWNETLENCAFLPIEVDKNALGFDGKVVDYVLATDVGEMYQVPYAYKSETVIETKTVTPDIDFGYDYVLRDATRIGDENNILATHNVGDTTHKGTNDNYIFNKSYIDNIAPKLKIGDDTFSPYGYTNNDELHIVFNFAIIRSGLPHSRYFTYDSFNKATTGYAVNYDYLVNYSSKLPTSKSGCRMYSYMPRLVTVDYNQSATGEEYWVINPVTKDKEYNGRVLLADLEKKNDAVYLRGTDKPVFMFGFKTYTHESELVYFNTDPVAAGYVKPLKRILFTVSPGDVFKDPDSAVPELRNFLLKKSYTGSYKEFYDGLTLLYELESWEPYDPNKKYFTHDKLDPEIYNRTDFMNRVHWLCRLFGGMYLSVRRDDLYEFDWSDLRLGNPNFNLIKMKMVTIDGEIPFVVPKALEIIPQTNANSNCPAPSGDFVKYFKDFVNKFYPTNIENKEIEERRLDLYKTKSNTKYIQFSYNNYNRSPDKVDRFNQNGIFYTLLVENETDVDSDKTVDELIEEARKKQYWISPNDYYSQSKENTLYCATDGTGYYKYGDDRDNRPNWFWLDSLKSWCTFKTNTSNVIKLCVWNGRNNWDSLEEILKYYNEEDTKIMAKRYMYSTADILIGPSFDVMPYSNKPSAYPSSRKHRRWVFWTRRKQYENHQPSLPFVKKTIRLMRDTKFAIHDSNTYQTIKPARVYIDDVMKRYIFPIGCPMIERAPSGELLLSYHLELFGVNDKPLITEDMIKFMNSICISFFGDGSDKTIDDWKVFRKVDYSQEVPSETFATDEDSSLFEKEEINTSVIKGDFASLEFSIPTEYPTTDGTSANDFVERWDK